MGQYRNIPKIVEVIWEDHYSIGDDWYEPDFKHNMCILTAIGYLVNEDSNYYYIACTYDLENGNYSAGTAVLKNCVVNYQELRPEQSVEDSNRKPFKTKGKALNVKPSRGRTANEKNPL